MKCPNDGATLVISERQNIEIDYCPECRGVWLDRGELDKIIERSGNASQSNESYSQPLRDDNRNQAYDDNHHHKKKRKGDFLGDLFDF